MYIGFYSFTKQLNKNKLFFNPNFPIGDNLIYPFFLLAQRLKEQGHKASTIDTDNIEKFDAIVFLEFPTLKNKYFRHLIKNKFKNLYLITLESPIIKPDSYNTENHKYGNGFCGYSGFIPRICMMRSSSCSLKNEISTDPLPCA